MKKKQILVLTTGGTIEKSYDELDGSLENRESLLKSLLLSKLRLPHTEVELQEVMAKDSLHMTEEDRHLIYERIIHHSLQGRPIIVLHGTDTMEKTAEHCFKQDPVPRVPVIFTGAMRPVGFEDSDARQNFTEALMAAHLLEPGFYISFHNHLFKVPKVTKNKQQGTFIGKD